MYFLRSVMENCVSLFRPISARVLTLLWLFVDVLAATSVNGTHGKHSNCGTLKQVSEELWAKDVNRLSPEDITVNFQNKIVNKKLTHQALERFFTNVNEEKLSGATFQAFISLLDNYWPDKGVMEVLTKEERNENQAFLTSILNTAVMDILLKHLQCKGLVTNKDDLNTLLTKIWFDFYPRNPSTTVNDSSGFEHVLVGEYKSKKKVNGFHNWLSFYLKEKTGLVKYYGYVAKHEPNMVEAAFKWNKHLKLPGSFFVGVSPEFDIAIYTLCFLTSPKRKCSVLLNGSAFSIMTFAKNGHMISAFIDL